MLDLPPAPSESAAGRRRGARSPAGAVIVVEPAPAIRWATGRVRIRKVVGSAKTSPGKAASLSRATAQSKNGQSRRRRSTSKSPMIEAEHVKVATSHEEEPEVERGEPPRGACAPGGPGRGERFGPAETETVTAIRQLSDGPSWSDSSSVGGHLAACLEDADELWLSVLINVLVVALKPWRHHRDQDARAVPDGDGTAADRTGCVDPARTSSEHRVHVQRRGGLLGRA